MLFIDSSHALKIDSDVAYLFLEVLPRLKPGVVLHRADGGAEALALPDARPQRQHGLADLGDHATDPLAEELELRRRFVAGYHGLRERDPEPDPEFLCDTVFNKRMGPDA